MYYVNILVVKYIKINLYIYAKLWYNRYIKLIMETL